MNYDEEVLKAGDVVEYTQNSGYEPSSGKRYGEIRNFKHGFVCIMPVMVSAQYGKKHAEDMAEMTKLNEPNRNVVLMRKPEDVRKISVEELI